MNKKKTNPLEIAASNPTQSKTFRGKKIKDDICDFNHEGFCIVTDEFPELKNKPCSFNKNGLCTAKPENLATICSDCGEEHEWYEGCYWEREDTLIGSNENRSE